MEDTIRYIRLCSMNVNSPELSSEVDTYVTRFGDDSMVPDKATRQPHLISSVLQLLGRVQALAFDILRVFNSLACFCISTSLTRKPIN